MSNSQCHKSLLVLVKPIQEVGREVCEDQGRAYLGCGCSAMPLRSEGERARLTRAQERVDCLKRHGFELVHARIGSRVDHGELTRDLQRNTE